MGVVLKVMVDCEPRNPREEFENLGKMVCFHRRYRLGDESHVDLNPHTYIVSLACDFDEQALRDKIKGFYMKEPRQSITGGDEWLVEIEGETYIGTKADVDEWIEEQIDVLMENPTEEIYNTALDIIDANAVFLPVYLYDHGGLAVSTKPFHCPWDSGQVGFIYVSNKDVAKEFEGVSGEEALKKARDNLINEVGIYNMYLQGLVYGFTVESESDEESGKSFDPISSWGLYGIEQVRQEIKALLPEELADLANEI